MTMTIEKYLGHNSYLLVAMDWRKTGVALYRDCRTGRNFLMKDGRYYSTPEEAGISRK